MELESKLEPGQIMGGRYSVSERIGSGGMSHVYLAEDLRLPGKHWAVKESVTSASSYGDVQAEAALLITLNHRRLPRVVDFYPPDSDGYSYLIMDYIEGVTLSRYMKENPGAVSPERIIRFAGQLLEVLQYLHGHHPPIVYRDLKPSNIMLTPGDELVLIDFGIARSYGGSRGEDTVKLGTVGFAAPEQYGGESAPASDLYGLGALLLYMATGGRYSEWSPGMESKLRGKLPGGMIPIIRRLLRFDPEERYRDASAVRSALEPFLEELTIIAPSARKLVVASGGNRPHVVAFLGIAAGLGTTHTSFAASVCLSQYGSVAWVDAGPDSPVFERLRTMLVAEARSGSTENGCEYVDWKGVHYWRCPAGKGIAEILERGYVYLVMDLGTGGYKGALDDFVQSDVPVLVGSGADWRLGEMLYWLRRTGLHPQPGWKFALALSGETEAGILREALGSGKVYGLPCQRNPFLRKGRLNEVLREMFQEIMERRRPGRGGALFRRRTR